MMDLRCSLHAKKPVCLRHDQLLPLIKVVNKKEQLDKRAGGGGEKSFVNSILCAKLKTGLSVLNFLIFCSVPDRRRCSSTARAT
jgi:hypothetical protein